MFENVIQEIDRQIARLQQAKALLGGGGSGKRPGRPAGSENATGPKKRRTMSAAGRKAIAEAQRKRWAAVKAAAKK
jgi:hypothetical protein